jgi:oxalate---CoA ligase
MMILDIWESVERFAREIPDQPAIVEPDEETISYSQLIRRIEQLTFTLAHAGVQPGRCVAAVMPSGALSLVTLLGVSRHFCCAPVNPALTAFELDAYLWQIEAEAIILPPDESGIPPETKSTVCSTAERLGIGIIKANWNRRPERDSNPIPPVNDPQSVLPAPELPINKDCPALYLQTSATTGKAKVVMHTRTSMNAGFENTRRALALTAQDRVLLLSPLFHAQAIISAMAQLLAGGSVLAPRGFDASRFNGWLEEQGVTWYTCGPTVHHAVLAQLRNHPLTGPASLRFVRSSGAALNGELVEEMTQTLGVPILNAYGLTETGAITSMTPLCHSMAKSEPEFALPAGLVGRTMGLEIAVIDSAGQRLAPRQDGEIAVRGSSLFAGYKDDAPATAIAFRDGWFRTGDCGHLDEAGNLYLLGRIKEIVNRGGQKIIPEEVEAVICAHPAVREAAVFAIPHPTLGEEAACAIVLKDGITADETELRQFTRNSLAFYKVPRRIFFVDKIPRGSTGKPQRVLLAERFGKTPHTNRSGSDQAGMEGGAQAPASTTPSERRLHEIWCRMLKSDDLGFDEDFFAAGGDSLTAVNMLAEVDLRFGSHTAASAAAFFDNPTLSALAGMLRRTSRPSMPDERSSCKMEALEVRIGSGHAPLFCIPADGDEGLYFRRLAKHLSADYTLTILRPQNTWYAESPRMIEQAAQEAVQLIMTHQSEGACRVTGYCFGGIVAFEAARQLRAQGRDVQLILMDAPTPGSPGPLRDLGLYLRRGMSEFASLRRTRDFRKSSFNMRRLIRRITWVPVVHARAVIVGLWGFPPLRRMHGLLRRNNFPLYLPQPVDAPILHLMSAKDEKMLRSASRLGWRRVARGGIDERIVPLDHDAFFAETNLPILSEIVENWLASEPVT